MSQCPCGLCHSICAFPSAASFQGPLYFMRARWQGAGVSLAWADRMLVTRRPLGVFEMESVSHVFITIHPGVCVSMVFFLLSPRLWENKILAFLCLGQDPSPLWVSHKCREPAGSWKPLL